MPRSISRDRPAATVGVIKRKDYIATSARFHFQFLATVSQASRVRPDQRNRGVESVMCAKGNPIRCVDDQQEAVRWNQSARFKRQVHTSGKVHPVQVESQAAAAIMQFDELELA